MVVGRRWMAVYRVWGTAAHISGIHVDHRHLRKAISLAGIPIVFCAKCGGARTGHTGGLVKSCAAMCASGASKDRLKRLWEGKHPYKVYNYLVQSLGPVGDTWEARECMDHSPVLNATGEPQMDV